MAGSIVAWPGTKLVQLKFNEIQAWSKPSCHPLPFLHKGKTAEVNNFIPVQRSERWSSANVSALARWVIKCNRTNTFICFLKLKKKNQQPRKQAFLPLAKYFSSSITAAGTWQALLPQLPLSPSIVKDANHQCWAQCSHHIHWLAQVLPHCVLTSAGLRWLFWAATFSSL